MARAGVDKGLEGRKNAVNGRVAALQGKISSDQPDFDALDQLSVFVENDEAGKKALSIKVSDARLRIGRAEKPEDVYAKIEAFLTEVEAKLGVIAEVQAGAAKDVEAEVQNVQGDAEAVTQPLVPGKDAIYWRDVNAEVELLANAFKGTEHEALLRDLRKKSHKRQLGKEDLNIVIGEDTLQIWEDDVEDKVMLKVAKFVEAVKRHNQGVSKPTVAKQKDTIDPIYWRDVIAGIDALVDAYPDEDFKALDNLRDMLQKGEIGRDSRLLLSVGSIFLNILEKDDEELMLEKISVFIGELKQVASATQKGEEPPIDPDLERTYWRDIDAALEELDPVYGNNPQFKILRLSIKKGTLGTVKNFKATIGGATLEIRQSDTDVQMRDKLSKFVRELSDTGRVKINDEVRKQHAELERRYADLESNHQDLESRYKDASSDMHKQAKTIRRLEDTTSQYEDEIRRLRSELDAARSTSRPAPPYPGSRSTSRSYSG
jgi:hypothetical protein